MFRLLLKKKLNGMHKKLSTQQVQAIELLPKYAQSETLN
jgi:hypothetical protein